MSAESHARKVNYFNGKLGEKHNPFLREWFSYRFQAHRRAHDEIVANGILGTKKDDAHKGKLPSRKMYHSQEEAYKEYRATRGREAFDVFALFGTMVLGMGEMLNTHTPMKLETLTGFTFLVSFTHLLLSVVHEDQYAAIIKAHSALEKIGLRSEIKPYEKPKASF